MRDCADPETNCQPGQIGLKLSFPQLRGGPHVQKSLALAVPVLSQVPVTVRRPHNLVSGSKIYCLHGIRLLLRLLYTQKASFLGWISE